MCVWCDTAELFAFALRGPGLAQTKGRLFCEMRQCCKSIGGGPLLASSSRTRRRCTCQADPLDCREMLARRRSTPQCRMSIRCWAGVCTLYTTPRRDDAGVPSRKKPPHLTWYELHRSAAAGRSCRRDAGLITVQMPAVVPIPASGHHTGRSNSFWNQNSDGTEYCVGGSIARFFVRDAVRKAAPGSIVTLWGHIS